MSFIYAFSGILKSLKSEFNLRFHLVIAQLSCIFAYFYGLGRPEWAILILMAFGVIALELVNTAIENAIDTATDKILPTAKLAKDAAAGAVLVLAIASILVGICLFGDFQRIAETLTLIFTDAKKLVPCLFIGILDILFLFLYKEKN